MFRRMTLLATSLAFVLACLLPAIRQSVYSFAPAPDVIRVEGGQIAGTVAEGVRTFKGIPFAAPPVGELRWKAPQPAAKWSGVRQANEFGARCMQGRPYPDM